MTSYYSLSVASDQKDNLSAGYLLLEKSIENYSIWQSLRIGDEVFVAPLTVPFRIYHAKVRGVGMSLGAGKVRNNNGLIVYTEQVLKGDNIKTDLYNLQLFSKACELTASDAISLGSLCDDTITQKTGDVDDIFPLHLPNEYVLRPAISDRDDEVIQNMASSHAFGVRRGVLQLVMEKNGIVVGAASIHPRGQDDFASHAEKQVFGNALTHLIDHSVYIDRTYTFQKGEVVPVFPTGQRPS